MTSQHEGISGLIVADRYRLVSEIARTEAGILFNGEDIRLRREVSIEMASRLDEPSARRKWMLSAKLAQQLVGDHVLRILDVGDSRGVAFLVRERSARTLAEAIRQRGPIPLAQAVGWTLDTCEAIAEAHARGIAHGDLRLENIHLSGAGLEQQVKVAWTSGPEPARTAREDVARDIAALGAMLRILAMGLVSEDGEDSAPTLPAGLAHAVARSLAQESAGGFHSIAELARSLAAYAPAGHPAVRNIARILSRAGIVSGAVPAADLPRATVNPVDRASFTDEWFANAPQAALGPPRPAARAGAIVSFALMAAVLMATVLIWNRGMLPRWTGLAPPPNPVGTTELTSGSARAEEHAVDLANGPSTDPSLNSGAAASEVPAPTAPATTEAPAPATTEAPAPSPWSPAPPTD